MTDANIPAEMLQAFFASCPEMLFIAEADGKLLHWSDSLGTMLGASAGRGKPLDAVVHPEDQAALSAAWDRLRQGTASMQLNVRLTDAQATYRLFSLTARRSADGDRFHGSLREATPAGPSLKERILDAITSNLDIVIWAIDADNVFVCQEGKGLSTTGVPSGFMVGKNLYEVFPNQKKEWMPAVSAGETFHNFSTTHNTEWENWTVPVRGAGGTNDYVLGIALNVTEMKSTDHELRARLAQIDKQQEVIRNLSTPIIEVWSGVLTLPMVGVVDSVRTADVMDTLLTRIVESQARFAILDLTGVDVVDTRVASHLIELVTAIRLLGAEGIVAGIKPTVAQTIVSLGLDLSQIVTHRNLRAALGHCIKRMNEAAPTVTTRAKRYV